MTSPDIVPWDTKAGILIAAVIAAWVLLLLVAILRRTYHVRTASDNIYYVRRWGQFFQIWFYSFFYTLNYMSDVAAIVAFAYASDWMNVIIISGIVVVTTAIVSTVDVIGDLTKSSSTNTCRLSTWLMYMLTMYLPRVVYKCSGHPEHDDEREVKGTALYKEISALYNHITPEVGNVRDILQLGALYQGIPTLLVYSSALMLNSDVDDNIVYVAMAFSFATVILAGLFGDWETSKKDFNHSGCKLIIVMIMSFLKRTIEICGRLGYFIYFQAVTGWGIYIALILDLILMRLCYIQSKPSASTSRLSNEFHKITASWGSVFFGFYRRVSVDKNVDANNTMMPAAIELVRYLFKFLTTATGYFVILGLSTKKGWFHVEEDVELTTYFFFIGVGCNILLFLVVFLVEFLCLRRKTVRKADFKLLFGYWKSKICPALEIHIGLDIEHQSSKSRGGAVISDEFVDS
mmetsp:Transcript_16849/g.19117  ORF Transcript_16849/g.19117 Transcript_16849/m.19117 type:complete len:461 (-) Transcript_16849:41-1423(-)